MLVSSFQNKLLVLRFPKLSYLPPAINATEILIEKKIPLLVLEYGGAYEKSYAEEKIPRLIWKSFFSGLVPRPLRVLVSFVETLIRLCLSFAIRGKPFGMVAHGLSEQCLAWLLRLIFRVEYVVAVHEIYDEKDLKGISRLFFRLEKYCLAQARFLIFPEAKRATIYQQRYCLTNPIHIVFNCPRLRSLSPPVDIRMQLGIHSHSDLMIYLGGIGKPNLLEDAIESLVKLPNLFFLLAGWCATPLRKKLEKKAQKLGVRDRVLFLGIVEKEKWILLENADLSYCVYQPDRLRLEHAATASNKLMESMAAGLPVLASPREDFRSVVKGCDIGECLQAYGPGFIAKSIQKLLVDPKRYRQRQNNCLFWHREKFNFEFQFEPAAQEFQSWYRSKLTLTERAYTS